MRLDRPLLSREIDRKLFHLAWALPALLYYFGYPRGGLLLLLLVELLIWVGLELLRKAGYSLITPSLMRDHERAGAPMGTLYQISSMFLAVLLFDREIAVLAMLFCAVGDSATALAGAVLQDYLGRGRTAIRSYSREAGAGSSGLAAEVGQALAHRKSPVLMLVMFAACSALGLLLFPGKALLLLFCGAAGAVLADAFAWRFFGFTVDDDLTITLFSGALMSLAAWV